MPWQVKWIPPELAFTCHHFVQIDGARYKQRRNINVYHCYKNEEPENRLTYWYTLGDGLDSWGDPTNVHNFDIRNFATYDKTLSHQQIMQAAIDRELCTIEDIMIYIHQVDRGNNAKH